MNEQLLDNCAALEALLLITDRPLKIGRIVECLKVEEPAVSAALEHLQNRYAQPEHGFEIANCDGGYFFQTKPSLASVIESFTKVKWQRLSAGAMQTLAIIAYRQPVMKEEIDKIRGVDGIHFIRTLLDKQLVEIKGRSELPGRPMLYGTTSQFLEIFGIESLSDLPPLHELEKMVPQSEIGNDDPEASELQKKVGALIESSEAMATDWREDEKALEEIRERIREIRTTTPLIEEALNPPEPETEAAPKELTLES